MLTEFDHNTIANMTAALEAVCRKIPADKDNHKLRKQVGNAMIAAANSGTRSFVDLQTAGQEMLDKLLEPERSNWLRWLKR
jgi:hypothetical protein